MRDREQAIVALYVREAAELERLVARSVIASPTVIEEACSHAWCQLIRRLDDIDVAPATFWWLYRVAVREAWRLAEKARRCIPVGDGSAVGAVAAVAARAPADLLEARSALDELDSLSERQRRIVLMQAIGFTYAEIGRLTGDSVRTVERQLRRARQTLGVTAARR